MKNLEFGTVKEVHAKKFVVLSDDKKTEIVCYFDGRRHMEPGINAPLMSRVPSRAQSSDVKVGTRVVLRRRPDTFARPDQEEVRADWAFEAEYTKAESQRLHATLKGKQLTLPGAA